MAWLVGLVVAIGFVWLLIVSPRFRVAAIVVVGGLAAIIFFYISSENQRQAKSHTLITPSQLDLNGVTLSGRSDFWDINGTIKNNSAHTLTGLTLKVTVSDCASDCIVVGEDDSVYVSVTVPPSQLRTFHASVYFNNMPTPKKLSWNYQFVETTGQ
jgi:hypothetical protein